MMLSETNGVIIIEGHVQGLANTRALGRQGIPVVVIDKGSCVAASSSYCTKFFKCPDYNSAEFIDYLINLCEEESLKNWVLLPSNDHAVYNISKNIDLLARYFKTSIGDISLINQIYNKANLLELASNLSVPIPETYYLADFKDLPLEKFKFPILTKGKQGLDFYKKMGKKAFLANNKEELEEQIKEIESVFPLQNTFSQELIPFDGTNKTLSLAAFAIDGEIKTYWMGVKLREHPHQFGTATFTESVYEAQCLESSKKLLQKLGYTGICEVEFLRDPRDYKYKLIEINARTWLWVGHAIASGVNFPLYLYNYLNHQPNNYPNNYTIGLKWRNPISDFIFNIIGLYKGHIKRIQLKEQNKGEIINALWDKDDKNPFFKYLFLMLSFLKNR